MAANIGSFQQVEKLHGTNYESWKTKMICTVRFNELWDYVTGEKQRSKENAETLKTKDEKALELITLCLHTNQYSHVKNATTSKEAWDNLKKMYESNGPMLRHMVFKQLFRMKESPNQGMAEYINDFMTKIDKLVEAELEFPEDITGIMLLNSLTSEYETFCIAIETQKELLSLDQFKAKLVEEEMRKNHKENSDDALAEEALMTRRCENIEERGTREKGETRHSRQDKKCYVFGKIGHFAKDCRTKRKHTAQKNYHDAAMTAKVLKGSIEIEHRKSQDIWCLDSGATTHVCHNRN